MWKTLVFDVNETLLELGALDPVFERFLGDAGARRSWFAQVLASAMTITLTGGYRPFDEIGAKALKTTAARFDRELTPEALETVAHTMRHLPAHPEVPAALRRLREAGYRLVALTNSPPEVMREQLASSGLDAFFDDQLSADAAQALKPALVVYRTAAEYFGNRPEDMLMIAAHAWDLAGAAATGMDTAFVARPGQYPDPVFAPPTITGRDMTAVTDAILAGGDGTRAS